MDLTNTCPRLRTHFSPRERQIAELIGDGESYAQIGEGLSLSPNTVRSYVRRMAAKVDLEGDRSMEPRLQVFALVMFERWSRRRAS